jgi:hypothetical protein
MSRKFTSNSTKEIFYKVVEEKWMDKNTYLIVFQTMTDMDGDEFHLEAEYHKDEDKICYILCYEDEVMDGTLYVSPQFKNMIEEYILQEVGVISNDEFISTRNISVELKLAVPKDMTLGEFQEWLKECTIEVKRIVPTAKEKLMSKIRILEIKNKG